jgi:hypothetical protein
MTILVAVLPVNRAHQVAPEAAPVLDLGMLHCAMNQ